MAGELDDTPTAHGPDFTVFDLAEQIAGGLELSKPANVEVAKELLAWAEEIRSYEASGCPMDAAEVLHRLRARLHAGEDTGEAELG